MRDSGCVDAYHQKQSGEFVSQMEGYLLMLEDELMQFQDVDFRGYRIKSSQVIDLFYHKFLDIPLLSRMEAVMEYLIDEYETLAGKDLEEDRTGITGRCLCDKYKRDIHFKTKWVPLFLCSKEKIVGKRKYDLLLQLSDQGCLYDSGKIPDKGFR